MNEETALLDEFTVDRPHKSKLFDALIISSLSYIVFVLVDFVVNLKRLTLKSFDWQLAIVILILPFLGIIFHLNSKKVGWVINCFYYSLITSVFFYSYLRHLFDNKNVSTEINWRIFLLITLALIPTILLLSNSIRKYFRISTLLLTITLGISICLAIIMAFTIIH